MEAENGSLEDEFSRQKGPFSTSRIVGKKDGNKSKLQSTVAQTIFQSFSSCFFFPHLTQTPNTDYCNLQLTQTYSNNQVVFCHCSF